MADNIAAKSDAATTLGTLAADDVGGILYVRNKITLGADGSNDGDLSSANPMPVTASALPLPSGAATAAKQDTGNTSLASIDGKVTACNTGAVVVSSSALPSGAATAAKQPALGIAGTASADVITIQGVASMTSVKVDGSAVTQPVSDASGSLTVDAPVGTPVFVRLSDGSSAVDTIPVSLASVPSHAVTNAGTFAVQADGSVASDSVDSGNPVKVGYRASTSVSGRTMVADADRVDAISGVDGVLIVRQDCNLEDIVTAAPVAITDGSSTSVISAQGAGIKFYLSEISIANSSSSNVTVDLRDGTAGSVKWTFPVPANGGVVKTFKIPLPFSANTAMAADPSAAASTITVSALGFKSKV